MWYLNPVKPLDRQALQQAKKHQSMLTKPQGSLGQLESLAERFCAWQGCEKPIINTIGIRVFAADHGVCDQGVSAFPQEVTAQMVQNFITGGAAISVLSQRLAADFKVVNVGVKGQGILNSDILVNAFIAPGSKDFSVESAMNHEQLDQALLAGRAEIDSMASEKKLDLFIGGEMGIGNTTSASAIYSAILRISPEHSVGPGTGVSGDAIQRKVQAVTNGLQLHELVNVSHSDPLYVLKSVGGFEIAALVGAYLACAQKGIPILVDGFICSAAALVATKINQDVLDWMIFSHQSAEPAHQHLIQYLKVTPILDLGMRLGEGSGAAVAVPILTAALDLHNNMATFSQANVSQA